MRTSTPHLALSAATAVLLALGLAACGGEGAKSGLGGKCNTTNDCESSPVALGCNSQKVCQPLCTTGRDCISTGGLGCEGQVCGPCVDSTMCAGYFRCVPPSCNTSCDDDNDCITTAYCEIGGDGLCHADKATGSSCQRDAECISGQCDPVANQCRGSACGDNQVGAGEECDYAGTACDASNSWHQAPTCNCDCQWTPHCGDGTTDSGFETCDDGANNSDAWARDPHCKADCQGLGPHCGDGTTQSPGETCDQGAANSNDWSASAHCNATCTGNAPYCGDNQVATGFEFCDQGAANSNTYSVTPHCRTDCQAYAPHCGDGVLTAGSETCDDGNTVQWDGCYQCAETDKHLTGTMTSGDDLGVAIAAWTDWRYVAAWTHSGANIYAVLLDGNNRPLVPAFKVNEDSGSGHSMPAIAITGPREFVVAWTGTFGANREVLRRTFRIVDADTDGQTDDIEADATEQVNACTNGNDHTRPAIAAWSDGSYVIVNDAYTSCVAAGSNYDIEAWVFDADDNRVGTQYRLFNSATAGSQDNPTVATWSSPAPGFVVAWVDDNDTGVYSIRAARALRDATAYGYSFTGSPTHFEPSSAGTNACTSCTNHRNPVLKTWPDGTFLVAWDAVDPTTSRNIYFQAYTNTASPLTKAGEQVVVNTYLTGIQEAAAVIGWLDSRFVIVWSGETAASATYSQEITAQMYIYHTWGSEVDPARTANFGINDYRNHTQKVPAAAAALDGPTHNGAIFGWEAQYINGENDYGVATKRFTWAR